MLRTVAVSGVTAIVTAAITATSGFAGHNVIRVQSVQITVGDSAHFAVSDLLCVNESASGSPRFKTTGVACSSDAQPYRGLDFWFTRTRVIITGPAVSGGQVLYNLKR